MVNILMRLPVGDSKSYTKLMDFGVKSGVLKKVGNQYRTASANAAGSFFVLGDDKNLFIASDSALYNNYQASIGKPNSFFSEAPFNRYKASSTLFYANIASTIRGLIADSTKPGYRETLYRFSNTCKEVVLTSDNFDGKTIHSQGELIMQQADTNSLISLIRFLSVTAKEVKKQDEKFHAEMSKTPILENIIKEK
jgi:hypothetical protein